MKTGTSDNPKLLGLAERLEVSVPQAIGHLELLWEFAAKYAYLGDVGKWPNRRIATYCQWQDEPDTLIDALVSPLAADNGGQCPDNGRQAAGWLDRCVERRLVIHDWPDHAPDFVKKRASRANETLYRPVRPDNGGPCPDNGGQRGHKGSLAKGSQAKGSQGKKARKKRRAPASQKPRKRDLHHDAFKAAFDKRFPDAYPDHKGDFVQLAKWRKAHPDVTPEAFVEVAEACWDAGEYCPKVSLTVRGLCTAWSELRAKLACADDEGTGSNLAELERNLAESREGKKKPSNTGGREDE